MTAYFVTGATGFIGRHLVERLLEREGDIYVLVRDGSREKLDRLIAGWGQPDRIKPVVGDLGETRLGIASDELKGQIDHFFHLAAIYDMGADETRNALLNVGGTQHAIDLANALEVGTFHHMSSIAVAGLYDQGTFNEDMFDEGQKLAHPYHRTKFESEKLVRERVTSPYRIYRPSVVVGDSRTGEMDKVDGPYYFFKLIQKIRHTLPEWFPLISLEWGWTNIVPVDYVAAVVDHIAHQHGLDGQTFHVVDPKGQRVGDVLNTFAEAGHAPKAVMRIDKRATQNLPKGVISFAMKLPALKQIRAQMLADLGIPDEVIEYIALSCRFDARDTQRALRDTDITLPPLASYAEKLWDYWERTLDPDLYKDRSFEGAVNGKTVVITGACSGIGRAAALKIAAAGGIPILVARTQGEARRGQGRDRGRGRHRVRRTRATCATSTRSSSSSRRCSPTTRGSTCWSTTPGRIIRRSVALSYDRFHDYERTVHLNYLSPGQADAGAAAAHARPGRRPHRQRLLDRRADQPAALQRLRRLQGGAGRVHARGELGDDRRQRHVHDDPHAARAHADDRADEDVRLFPTISPEEAADLVCEAIRAKPKQINTKLGTFGEVAYALAPKAVDQILHLAYRVFPESTAAKGGKGD